MRPAIEISGFDRVIAQLSKREQLAKTENCSAITGYTAAYAVYVHEDRAAGHTVGKAGFLLDPFRRLEREIGSMVLTGVRSGLSLAQSILRAMLRVQRESQKEVPVDTGALRNSAFTRLE